MNKIDEKKLDLTFQEFLDMETEEMFRLARLGLWAEKYAIPAMNHLQPLGVDPHGWMLKDALAALPPATESRSDVGA